MKITGFKSEKKQDFSTSAKAWMEKILTCCVSARRLAFPLEVSVDKAKYIQIMRFIHQHMSIRFGKKKKTQTSALLKWGTRPTEIHSKYREPYAKADMYLGQIWLLTLVSNTVGRLHYLKYSLCISQLCKSQLYTEICGFFIYWCKLSQFHGVSAGCLLPRLMQLISSNSYINGPWTLVTWIHKVHLYLTPKQLLEEVVKCTSLPLLRFGFVRGACCWTTEINYLSFFPFFML